MSTLRWDSKTASKRSHLQTLDVLRRSRRSEFLSKRRIIETPKETRKQKVYPLTFEEEISSAIRRPIDELNDLVHAFKVSGCDDEKLFNVLMNTKAFLERDNNGSSILIRPSGLLNMVVVQILNTDETISSLSAEVLSIYVCCGTTHGQELIEENIVEVIVRKIVSPSVAVRRNLIHLLANLAGESSAIRDNLLSQQISSLILNLSQAYITNPDILNELGFLVTNLCNNAPYVKIEFITPLFPFIKMMLRSIVVSLCVDGIWSVDFLAQNPENIGTLCSNGFLDELISFLESARYECVVPAIVSISTFMTGDDNLLMLIQSKGVLDKITHLFKSDEIEKRQKENLFLFLVDFIRIPTQPVVSKVIVSFIPAAITAVLEETPQYQIRPAYLISEVVQKSEAQNLISILNLENIFDAFKGMLQIDDQGLMESVLEMVLYLLKFECYSERRYGIFDKFNEIDLASALEAISLGKLSTEMIRSLNTLQGICRTLE
ncbi:importin subunit alpha-2, putative [Entamoeba invadens IP1]|uniref:Importin subunit alpha-2, putative n=1 Tax=Entamoeba invadens IP1 TaxID=370355 RepID=A0A0A1U854_ENTIV|nr:importin subunit alpha-2, putative [Entamoeba invadens IP1]ELP91011.1 importin subunit alpha-2, putative [Entamoeba invadens IP1]|eukprot:XP_004257782.1 importin subunit alpha-2, putative [Entamoeba invadens IP1]